MMKKDAIPRTIRAFTEYMKIAYQKVVQNMANWGISQAKLGVITPLYNDYIAKEALAADPDTATRGNREARDEARDVLEKEWRHFLNENIRYNTAISTADLAVFGITPRDGIRTPASVPTDTGIVSIKRLGAFLYEATVIDEENKKRKLPLHATGSYLYLAISETGITPESVEAYKKLDFSSNARHIIQFNSSDLGKQANVYVRYSNEHGKEGPVGPIESFFIN
ncbi:MAG: hypothetical protein LBR86_06605 [Tannerella sp.]|jgi:hypothetical protein|nr:hypothetical protein [Tannerella sp.]